jgi:hypothetical protein
MKTRLLITILALSVSIFAQTKSTSHTNGLACKTCHSCDIPTKENPCIKPCPREKMVSIEQSPSDSPNVVNINSLSKTSNIYGPVLFSHRLHAEMSGMGGGCKMCHHYNPPGKVAGCSDCHEANRKRTDISKPDLKGAYHQQCMTCHRQWSGKVDCISCHSNNNLVKKSTEKMNLEKSKKRIHPQIIPPATVKFETPKASGKFVSFNHSEHSTLFSIDCERCHSDQSCSKCHQKNKQTSLSNRTTGQKHALCANCHNVKSSCADCHSNGKVNAVFNHKERTGFDITKNHAKLTCNRCHTEKGKFTGLKSECSNCHGSWTKENFKHAVTGLQLDETHSDFDCKECHQEKNYANPTCKNCHDDKSFPKDKPGKMTKK